MKNSTVNLLVFLAIIGVVVFVACKRNFFQEFRNIVIPQTQREAYISLLKDQSDSLATVWDSTGNAALLWPLQINGAYSERARFHQSDAIAYAITIPAGRRLEVKIENEGRYPLFADLYLIGSGGSKTLFEADTTQLFLSHEQLEEATYVLRLQPGQQFDGYYKLNVAHHPILSWPVAAAARSRIGSFWGAGRDGGARSHEGIDIFASRGTPILAATDGYISRVGMNNLGGKVIFQRHAKLPFSIYYAHLDSQLVASGTRVQAGDTIGLMGNTGNAITTPPHLHLGIYTHGGAVNPLPFVEKAEVPGTIETALPDRAWQVTRAASKLHLSPDRNANTVSLSRHDTLYIKGITDSYYRIENPAGQKGFVEKRVLGG